MKLKDGFITYGVGDEQMLVSTGASAFNGLVKSNKTAAFYRRLPKKRDDKRENSR